jgi:hypothetical protein
VTRQTRHLKIKKVHKNINFTRFQKSKFHNLTRQALAEAKNISLFCSRTFSQQRNEVIMFGGKKKLLSGVSFSLFLKELLAAFEREF